MQESSEVVLLPLSHHLPSPLTDSHHCGALSRSIHSRHATSAATSNLFSTLCSSCMEGFPPAAPAVAAAAPAGAGAAGAAAWLCPCCCCVTPAGCTSDSEPPCTSPPVWPLGSALIAALPAWPLLLLLLPLLAPACPPPLTSRLSPSAPPPGLLSSGKSATWTECKPGGGQRSGKVKGREVVGKG